MKNLSGFICIVLLAVTTSTALPEGKDGKAPVKKAENSKNVTPAKSAIVVPVFQWYGPAINKPANMPGKKKDNC